MHSPVGGPVHSPVVSPLGGGASPSNPPVYLPGAALGPFTGGNYIESAAGQYVDLRPGMTAFLVFQNTGVGSSTTEAVVGSGDSTHGWLISRQAGTGVLYFLSSAGGFAPLVAPPNGVSTIAIVWKADNSVWYSINGLPFTQGNTGVTGPSAASGTWKAGIGIDKGTWLASTVPLASGRVLAFATWSTAASAAQAVQLSAAFGPVNRFQLAAAVRASAVVDFQANRDWNGVASTIATLGSAPLVYGITGTLTLIKCDEIRYAGPKWNAPLAAAVTDPNGNAIILSNGYGSFRCVTDALAVVAEADSTMVAQGSITPVGLWVNGEWSQEVSLGAIGTPEIVAFSLSAGAGKVLDVMGGPNAMGGGPGFPYIEQGTVVSAVRVPVFQNDGSTKANSAIVAPPAVQEIIAIAGDSIVSGWYADVFTEHGFPNVVRTTFPSSGTGRVVSVSAGSDSVGNRSFTAATIAAWAAEIVAAVAPATTRRIVMCNFGTNDCVASAIPVATYQAGYGALADAVHALDPSIEVWIGFIIPRGTETGSYATLSAYCTAAQAVAAARAAWCTYVDWHTSPPLALPADMYADLVHPNTGGIAKMAAAAKTAIGW